MHNKEHEKYRKMCMQIGHAINMWCFMMWHLDLVIIMLEADENPFKAEDNYRAGLEKLHKLDKEHGDGNKIKRFRNAYLAKPQYHDIVACEHVCKLLDKGLKARNFFAHTLLEVSKESGETTEQIRERRPDELPKFKVICQDRINEKINNIRETYSAMRNFYQKLYNRISEE